MMTPKAEEKAIQVVENKECKQLSYIYEISNKEVVSWCWHDLFYLK